MGYGPHNVKPKPTINIMDLIFLFFYQKIHIQKLFIVCVIVILIVLVTVI